MPRGPSGAAWQAPSDSTVTVQWGTAFYTVHLYLTARGDSLVGRAEGNDDAFTGNEPDIAAPAVARRKPCEVIK